MITHPLTVLTNGTPPLITLPSPPYTVTQLISQSVSQRTSQSARQLLFQLSRPVVLLLEVSQTLDKVYNQSVILSASQSIT